jgi:hypothetical protein
MRSSIKYIIGFLVFLAIIIGIIVLFTGGSKKSTDTVVTTTVSLADHVETAKVVYTIDGGIVGDDMHRAVRITVDKNNRTFEIIKGYEGTVEKRQVFPNNAAAFDVFMRSIDRAGFATKRASKLTDERGVCQDGLRYVYEVSDSSYPSRLWSTSCTSLPGTLGGSATSLEKLFKNQIPEYSQLVEGLVLLPPQ